MPSGIVLLDKPVGLSSNAALQRVRRLFGAAKAGHAGSLDPLATGMLPICLDEATKIAGEILSSRKRYRFAIALGVRTATGDAEGEVIERAAVPRLEPGAREAVDHLVELGHTHIAFLNHAQAAFDAGYGPSVRAQAAFDQAMTAAGLAPTRGMCNDSARAGHGAFEELIGAEPRLTALVAMNEGATVGSMHALAARATALVARRARARPAGAGPRGQPGQRVAHRVQPDFACWAADRGHRTHRRRP